MSRPKDLAEALPGLRRVVLRFWPYMKPQRRLMLGSLGALLASTVLRLLEPWPLKLVFDRVLKEGMNRSTGSEFVDTMEPGALLLACSLATVGIVGLRACADYVNTVGFSLAGNRALTQVRGDLFRHLQKLSLSFHTRARAGDLTVRVVSDINMLKDVIVTAALPLGASVLILLGMWGVMFALQPRLALLALAVTPLLWLSTTRLTRLIQDAARTQRKREGDLAATAAESITAIKMVQSLGLEGVFERDFVGRSEKSAQQDVRGSRLRAGLERWVDLLLAIATALVLGEGARLVLKNAMSPGDLLVFLTYLRRAFNPMQDFAKYTGRLAKAAAAGERVMDLLDRTPEVLDAPDAIPATQIEGHVAFEAVSFGYEPERLVLRDVSFEAEPGLRVAVVGASGIGKSTLAGLLLRLYDPTGGRILLDERDLRGYTVRSLRAQMAVVLQDSLLFAASVSDNIAYGAGREVSLEEIEAAAREANAHEFISQLPEGYNTVLGERGVTLSGGQRQRISIARAAIRRAPLLILDEPTAGLDEENERLVTQALERLSHGRTTFLITHDLRFASGADLILHFEGGGIAERGSHAELMRLNGRYAALFRLQTAQHHNGNGASNGSNGALNSEDHLEERRAFVG